MRRYKKQSNQTVASMKKILHQLKLKMFNKLKYKPKSQIKVKNYWRNWRHRKANIRWNTEKKPIDQLRQYVENTGRAYHEAFLKQATLKQQKINELEEEIKRLKTTTKITIETTTID